MKKLAIVLLLVPLAASAQWRAVPDGTGAQVWSYGDRTLLIDRVYPDGVRRVRPFGGQQYRPYVPMQPLQPIRPYRAPYDDGLSDWPTMQY